MLVHMTQIVYYYHHVRILLMYLHLLFLILAAQFLFVLKYQWSGTGYLAFKNIVNMIESV